MKNILKKVRALSIVLFSIVLAVSVLGCPSDSGTPTSGTTFQSQIDAATPGSTVTLNTSYSGSSITINKALTVNGNGISNLSIYVSSNVANNVTLRNFRNANVTVASSSRRALDNRMARAANDADEPDHFKKMGEDALQLKLEGCEITKFDAEADVALFLESGDGKKSEIEELNLKAGVEEFTFIEIDKANKPETTEDEATPTEDKSSVGELKIEGEDIGKINLIGGKFDEVSIPDDFAGSDIDFKYDKEFDDQFGEFDGKDAFFGNEKIAEKDVSVVEKTLGQNENGVYKLTISKENFEKINGGFSIMFMTPSQLSAIQNGSAGVNLIGAATFENPVYMAIPAGAFKVANVTDSGLKSAYGTEWAYVDYAHAFARGQVWNYGPEDIVVLDYYRNYNKEAFIFDIDDTNVNIYVNTKAIKKSDLITCAWNADGTDQYDEAGSKVSELDLTGYVPYLAISNLALEHQYMIDYPSPEQPEWSTWHDPDTHQELHNEIQQNFEAEVAEYNSTRETWQQNVEAAITAIGTLQYQGGQQQGSISIEPPYHSSIKLTYDWSNTLTEMEGVNDYPDVENVTYSSIRTPHQPGTLHPLQIQDFD